MNKALQRVHIHHPALLRIAEVTPGGDVVLLDGLSSLNEERIESDIIIPLMCPLTLRITILTGKSYIFTIPIIGEGIPEMVEHLNDIGDVNVPSPLDGYIPYWNETTSLWECKLLSLSKIIDADGDTSVDVEQSEDEDKIRGIVKGIEALLLDDNGIFTIAKQSSARAELTGSQTIQNNEWTKVTYNAEIYDVQNEYDPTTNYRFTAKAGGLYFVSVMARFQTFPEDGSIEIAIAKNGDRVAASRMSKSVPNAQYLSATSIVQLAANDYIEGQVKQASGSPQDVTASSPTTHILLHKVG
jgi:hypothetical protein